MIDKEELDSFLNEVRSCSERSCKLVPCEAGERCTPFFYGRPTSDILVVSEAPPKSAWRGNFGKTWEKTFNVTEKGWSVQSKLAHWLDIVSEPKERLFWIQRAYCCVSEDWEHTYLLCGEKYLSRAVELVDPIMIVTLGVKAADFFYHKFTTLKDLMKTRIESNLKPKKHQSYDIFPFYHPSSKAEIHRMANIELHQKMEKLARERIRSAQSD